MANRGMEDEKTYKLGDVVRPVHREKSHYLVVTMGADSGRFIALSDKPVVIGRSPRATVQIDDPGISGTHCRLVMEGETVWLEDLGSTNGTFLDEKRVEQRVRVPLDSVVQVGQTLLRYEQMDPDEVSRQAELAEELDRAATYVRSLLPHPVTEGPVEIAWRYVPSTHLAGDGFGYHWIDDDRFAFYLLDVCGHGVRAALHTVSMINILRKQSLPGIRFEEPAEVLDALNRSFQMDDHGDMYLTMWYGVYRPSDRSLRFASGGHPGALLRAPGDAPLRRLYTKTLPVGMVPDTVYVSRDETIPEGSLLYVFSDGTYEIRTERGRDFDYDEFEAVVAAAAAELPLEPRRIERRIRQIMTGDGFEDDFTLLILKFN
jgi:serine phosphatase RsbU (regulator of sigma subunit)